LDSILSAPKRLLHWTGLPDQTAFEKEFLIVAHLIGEVNFKEGTPKKNQRRNWFDEREYFFWFLVRLRRGLFFMMLRWKKRRKLD